MNSLHAVRVYEHPDDTPNPVRFVGSRRFATPFGKAAKNWFFETAQKHSVGHLQAYNDTTLAGYHLVDSTGRTFELI